MNFCGGRVYWLMNEDGHYTEIWDWEILKYMYMVERDECTCGLLWVPQMQLVRFHKIIFATHPSMFFQPQHYFTLGDSCTVISSRQATGDAEKSHTSSIIELYIDTSPKSGSKKWEEYAAKNETCTSWEKYETPLSQNNETCLKHVLVKKDETCLRHVLVKKDETCLSQKRGNMSQTLYSLNGLWDFVYWFDCGCLDSQMKLVAGVVLLRMLVVRYNIV